MLQALCFSALGWNNCLTLHLFLSIHFFKGHLLDLKISFFVLFELIALKCQVIERVTQVAFSANRSVVVVKQILLNFVQPLKCPSEVLHYFVEVILFNEIDYREIHGARC